MRIVVFFLFSFSSLSLSLLFAFLQPLTVERNRKKTPKKNNPVYFRLNEQPSVNLAFPPVGWHRTDAQESQKTTV